MISLRQTTALTEAFYDRDPRKVARALLGKLLIRNAGGKLLAGRLVETEAYLSVGDLAAHSASGKTERNSVLFGPPGYAYVYFIYGNHYCLNVSCGPEGVGGGVLFRAIEPVAGIQEMAQARGITLTKSQFNEPGSPGKISWLRKIGSGPGRMCDALGVTRKRDNGKSFFSAQSDLRIVDDGYRVRRVLVTPRIGINKSVDDLLRYIIEGNPFVSGTRLLRTAQGVVA
jgi:DNA-3-methyladenine glycosylase